MNKLHMVPAFNDNYIWLLEIDHKQVIIIDPGQAQPVINYLNNNRLNNNQFKPIAILLTHHHNDHIGGVTQLKNNYPEIEVLGPNEINLPITKISDKKSISIAGVNIVANFDVIQVPGHTLGHLAYYNKPYLFCGDTLFSAGCGRIFEGTSEQMYNSLNKLKTLPDDTIVCPAHEYTLSNLKFAHHSVPEDNNIFNYYNQIKNQKITLPTTIEKEKKINLFLRCDEPTLQAKFGSENELDLFIFFRTQKDSF